MQFPERKKKGKRITVTPRDNELISAVLALFDAV